jgi:hypothetical protein
MTGHSSLAHELYLYVEKQVIKPKFHKLLHAIIISGMEYEKPQTHQK